MDTSISDQKLHEVTEGKAAFDLDELVSLIPEVAGDVQVQLLAAAVATKRLVYGGRPRLLKAG